MAEEFLQYLIDAGFNDYEGLLAVFQRRIAELKRSDGNDDVLQAMHTVQNTCVARKRHLDLCSDDDEVSAQKMLKSNNLETERKKYVCPCGKSYRFRHGLYKHKKKCTGISSDSGNAPTSAVDRDMMEPSPAASTAVTFVAATPSQRSQASFNCRYCGTPFEDYANLVNHLELKHPIRQQQGSGLSAV